MYIAENPIRVFDDIQREECEAQAEAMAGSSVTLKDYIEFGRDWAAANSLTSAHRQYEQRRNLREFANREADNTWTEGPS